MNDPIHIFHLAIPCRDLDEAHDFYVNKLHCQMARRYDDRITLNFFKAQVVCHLSPDQIDQKPSMYPRHFGITFGVKKDFDELYHNVQNSGLPLFQELMIRFAGRQEEHVTFFLLDPSNNVLEFKYYHDASMMY